MRCAATPARIKIIPSRYHGAAARHKTGQKGPHGIFG
jgi:hypothetical protein